MENIPSNDYMIAMKNDLSPLFNLNLLDHVNEQSTVSLVEQLQTTLEIDQLLEIFSMQAAKVTRFVGLSFQFGQESCSIRGSSAGEHRLSFNIKVDNVIIGQLSYALVEPLNKTDVHRLDSLHSQLKYPLRNALNFHRVKKLALKDAMTGLGNRGHFDTSLHQAMLHAKRASASFALVMLDLDEFKQVNDTYGHQCGDEVIKAFANILRRSIRGDDNVFRLGGDEFAIIANGQVMGEANIIAARIQHNVANCPVMMQYGVSTSIGFTLFKNDDSVSSLYTRTDRALYAAKDFGRNCTQTA
jgi:diguanylate cyclase (GGDEF)-like protein